MSGIGRLRVVLVTSALLAPSSPLAAAPAAAASIVAAPADGARSPTTRSTDAPKYARVRVHEEYIPMRDGTRLAVNLFVPDGVSPHTRLPILLEYLPYRKDDWSLERDFTDYSYFVRRGFVAARLDIRGTGRSEGRTPLLEYSESEQRDAEDAIAWLASRPWSNGSVGMVGISWGGFNAIQMAMRTPHVPALKAIIAVDASDRLFHDDVHYIDGILHADEYELSMDLQSAETRAPDFPLDAATLRARFDNPPWFLAYLRHQHDGPFWRRASLAPRYERIRIPVFLIGGWYDGYRDSVPRMLGQLRVPVHAIVGPWNHTFPHDALPGPAIEWRASAVRFWNRWLRGERNGFEHEPKLTAFMRAWYPPGVDRTTIPGVWRSFAAWPAPEARTRVFRFEVNHLLAPLSARGARATTALASENRSSAAVSLDRLQYVPSLGAEAGFWWGELTPDQRPLDAGSLTYDSAPLQRPFTVLGTPVATLAAAASAPLANWIVRLCDVAPGGAVTLVTGGALAGAQRDSADRPQPLVPGRRYALRVPLHFTSWVFSPGHRVRVAVSNALWPMLWPTPYAMETSLVAGDGPAGSTLALPTVDPPAAASRVAFPAVTELAQIPAGVGGSDAGFPGQYGITRDVLHAATRIDWSGSGTQRFPWGMETTTEHIVYHQADCCAAKSSVHGDAATAIRLRNRTLVWHVLLDLRSNAHALHYRFTRELHRDGILLRTKTWTATIPRDLQ